MTLRRMGLAVVLTLAAASGVVAAPADDGYIEGYAAAVLQREFFLAAPSLRVRHGVITIDAADLASVDQAAVVAQLERIPGVARVELRPAGAPPLAAPSPLPPAETSRIPGEWQVGLLPGGVLFKPLIADPRWPHFSATWQRYIGDAKLKDTGSATFGESFSFYRVALGSGLWEIGLHAAVFAVFNLDGNSTELVNADYLVGIPLTYRYAGFSAMLRVFHQSSHLGDEFLLRTRTERINVRYESVDLKLSYEFGDLFRLYAGAGYLFDREPASLKPFSLQYGAEVASPWPSRAARWRPIAAVDVQNHQENAWSADVSARAGIQIDGVLLTRNVQILFEYFSGHSPNGQFYRDRVSYFGIGAHLHF
jgi:Protein of unknown function (DUF1207)